MTARIGKQIICLQKSVMALTCFAFVTHARRLQHAFARSNNQWQLSTSLQRSSGSARYLSSTRALYPMHDRRSRQPYIRSTPCSHRRAAALFSSETSYPTEHEVRHDSTHSRWSLLPRKQGDNSNIGNELIQNILVVGDGDLSFCAGIASELQSLNIRLFASVLEDESTHNKGEHFKTIHSLFVS